MPKVIQLINTRVEMNPECGFRAHILKPYAMIVSSLFPSPAEVRGFSQGHRVLFKSKSGRRKDLLLAAARRTPGIFPKAKLGKF